MDCRARPSLPTLQSQLVSARARVYTYVRGESSRQARSAPTNQESRRRGRVAGCLIDEFKFRLSTQQREA
eukprot:6927881-Prymnesium_polylepis.2